MPKDEWQAARNCDAARRARRPESNDESFAPTKRSKRTPPLSSLPGKQRKRDTEKRKEKRKQETVKWLNELAMRREADRQNELWTQELLSSPIASYVAGIATGQIMRAKLEMMCDLQRGGKKRTSRKKNNRR